MTNSPFVANGIGARADIRRKENPRRTEHDAAVRAQIMHDQAQRLHMMRENMRLTLARLVADLLAATNEGDSGVPEAARLHAWVRGELLPWSDEVLFLAPESSHRDALRSDVGLISGLASLLSGSREEDAAKWGEQIGFAGAVLITRTEYL